MTFNKSAMPFKQEARCRLLREPSGELLVGRERVESITGYTPAGQNSQPVGSCCVPQGTQTRALWQSGLGGASRGSGHVADPVWRMARDQIQYVITPSVRSEQVQKRTLALLGSYALEAPSCFGGYISVTVLYWLLCSYLFGNSSSQEVYTCSLSSPRKHTSLWYTAVSSKCCWNMNNSQCCLYIMHIWNVEYNHSHSHFSNNGLLFWLRYSWVTMMC